MTGSINKVILIGNVGRDPEIRQISDIRKVATFSIATSEARKDKNTDEKIMETTWHNIAIFSDGLVGLVEKFVKKGAKLYIEGSLRTRKWQDKEGNNRSTTEVVLRGPGCNLCMLDKRGDREKLQGDESSSDSSSDEGYYSDKEGLDDEVPF
ncbi:single-stranded DNA-binding protein [Rickettsiales bacterium]|nr:single-stranded DNA-binding protein [Rickettsiales bacterium]